VTDSDAGSNVPRALVSI